MSWRPYGRLQRARTDSLQVLDARGLDGVREAHIRDLGLARPARARAPASDIQTRICSSAL